VIQHGPESVNWNKDGTPSSGLLLPGRLVNGVSVLVISGLPASALLPRGRCVSLLTLAAAPITGRRWQRWTDQSC
jgi:hypothetical protein